MFKLPIEINILKPRYLLIIYSKESGKESQYKAIYQFNTEKKAINYLLDLKGSEDFSEVVDAFELWDTKTQESFTDKGLNALVLLHSVRTMDAQHLASILSRKGTPSLYE